MPEGAPTSALGARSGAPSGLRPSSFVMCNTPVEVQFIASAGCLNYPCRTPIPTSTSVCNRDSREGGDDTLTVEHRAAPAMPSVTLELAQRANVLALEVSEQRTPLESRNRSMAPPE